MATVRMFPARGGPSRAWSGSPSNVSGRRYYEASAGTYADVIKDDASTIASQGFFAFGDGSGTTADRPNDPNLKAGFVYLDTTLSLVVVWDGPGPGGNWRNPVSGAVA